MASRYKCPRCESRDTSRILYGLIDLNEKLDRDLERGNIHFGGSEASENDPNRHCNGCEHDFHTKAPNVYLDIDGVLLANDKTPANYAELFLKKVLEEHPHTTYWLTTHCQGDPSAPIEHIGHLFGEETIDLMKQIKPTKWANSKTEAIDFSKPFLWFDDDLYKEEKKMLAEKEALDNFIEVDLSRNPDQLSHFIFSFPIPANS